MRALAARSAGRLTLTQRLRAENKAQDPQHQIKNGRLRPPTLSNTCVVPKWRSLVLTIDDAGSFSLWRAGLPQGFVSRVSARKELRKPTTGWGGGRRGGRVCRWNWHRCTTARIPHGWPKTRDGRREVRASVGEVEGKKRLRPKRGLRGKEQGNGREKEAFKDCVRFVVTEGDRAQPGRGGLLATTGVMVVSPGVLERGGTGGQDRSVSIVRSARRAAGIAARSPFSQEGSVCQTANVVSPAEARFTKIHSTLCREVPPVSGKTARTVGYSQSNLPASRVPHQHFSLRAVTQELSNDRPQCPSHQTRGSAFQGLTAATPSCHLHSIFCCEAGPVNHFWPFSKGIGPWQRWKAARPPGKPR